MRWLSGARYGEQGSRAGLVFFPPDSFKFCYFKPSSIPAGPGVSPRPGEGAFPGASLAALCRCFGPVLSGKGSRCCTCSGALGGGGGAGTAARRPAGAWLLCPPPAARRGGPGSQRGGGGREWKNPGEEEVREGAAERRCRRRGAVPVLPRAAPPPGCSGRGRVRRGGRDTPPGARAAVGWAARGCAARGGSRLRAAPRGSSLKGARP